MRFSLVWECMIIPLLFKSDNYNELAQMPVLEANPNECRKLVERNTETST